MDRKLIRVTAHARLTGPYGNRSSTESREQTIANGMHFTAFMSLHSLCNSQQENTKYRQCSTPLGRRMSSRNTLIHASRRTQIHERA